MEIFVVGADAEVNGELAAASEGMDSKGRVTGPFFVSQVGPRSGVPLR